MDRQYVMTEKALLLAVLESTLRFLESGQDVLTESIDRIDEGKLQDIQNSVRAVIDLMKSSPEEYNRKMDSLIKNGYSKTLNAVKNVLARHGITATLHHPLTGYPAIERTSTYDDELDRDKTLKAIEKLVQSRTHQFDGSLHDNQTHTKLFVPTKQDGRWGYQCQVVGDLADDIEKLDGNGLTVTLTDSHDYGFEDAPFCEKTYFIALAQAQTA